MIRFFNTLSGKVEGFESLIPGEIRIYTCGPTVYDFPHIGNMRAYIFEDLLKRFLRFMNYRVTHVMNITDVDDKTIRGANAQRVSLHDYTQQFIDAFFEDIRILNILPADFYPRATEHIPEMVKIIKALLEKGYAYERAGSVYFSIDKFPKYGRLSKIDLQERKIGARVDVDEYEKESVYDFALWKNHKEGEPFWETEIGKGRPGWHIECSAMSAKYLGQPFDIHCGGVDNIFPHHENEIAQSEASSGKKFVNYWLHCHHLVVDGEKMSKSLGNFFTLQDLLQKKNDAPTLRFLLLSTHYRKMLNFTLDAVEQSRAALQRLKDFVYELENRPFQEGAGADVDKLIEEARKNFIEGLSDDLNISTALAAIFELVRKANILLGQDKLAAGDARTLLGQIHDFDAVLGVLRSDKEPDLSPEIQKKIEERENARREKKYALADKIRKELLDMGILLEDTKEGVRWKITKK
jgi:cysteinyl-tRNA synthetase